ncbi:MAG TPA: hypothetical protein VM204_06300, partial [Gaiellaceae bacterium]|nr:hypothetical protein [Gaiellaceae bacterium]
MQPDTVSSPREAPEAGREEPLASSADVRATRPYLLARGTLRALARRLLAVGTLALLDAVGLALGLYTAL